MASSDLSALDPNKWLDFIVRLTSVIKRWNENRTSAGFVQTCTSLNVICIQFVENLRTLTDVFKKDLRVASPKDPQFATEFSEKVRSLPAQTVKAIQKVTMQRWITLEQQHMQELFDDKTFQQGPEEVKRKLDYSQHLVESGTEDEWEQEKQAIEASYKASGLSGTLNLKSLKLQYKIETSEPVRSLLLKASAETDEAKRYKLAEEARAEINFQRSLFDLEAMINGWRETATKVIDLVADLKETCKEDDMMRFMGKYGDVCTDFAALSSTTKRRFPLEVAHWGLSDDDKLRELWIQERDICEFMLPVAEKTKALAKSLQAVSV